MPDPSVAVADPLLTTEPLGGSYTTAKPRVLNQPGDTIISDEQADEEIDLYPYYNQEQRAEADQKLADYFEEQHHKLGSERAEERQRQLLDPDNEEKAAFYRTPEVAEAVWLNKDPNKMWARHVITDVLEKDVLKRPLIDGEYEGAKNRWIAPFAGKATVDDNEALSTLAKRAEVEKETYEALQFASGNITKSIILDAMQAGKPVQVGEVWDQTRKSYPNAAKGRETELYEQTVREFEKQKEIIDRNGPQIVAAYTYLEKLAAGPTSGIRPTPEETTAMVDALISIPPEDLDETLTMLAGAVKTKVADEQSVKRAIDAIITEIGKAGGFTKLAQDNYSAANDLRLEAMRGQLDTGKARVDEAGNIVWFPVEVSGEAEVHQPLNAEQEAKARTDIERGLGINRVWRAVRGIKASQLDPHIFNRDYAKGVPAFLERSYFGAVENVGPMVLAGISYPLYVATIAPSAYERTMRENPLMDKRVAAGMSLIEANINWLGDNLQLKALKGAGLTRYLQGVMSKIPLGKPGARLVGIMGIETATEMGQDFFSDLGKSAFQEILLKVNPNLNVGQIKSFDKAMADVWENLPDTAGQMFFLTGFGVGVLTYRDVKDPKKVIYNRESLLTLGMDERTITQLVWETDFKERDRMFMEAFGKLTPEQRNNGILYQQKQAEAIKAKVASGGVQPAGEAAAEVPRPRPTLVAVTKPDGTRAFNLLDENGTVVRENMTEEVASAEYAAYDESLAMQERQRRVEAETSDEAVERTAAAEQAWELLSPAERTTTANVLEFSRNERPTPEQQSKLAALQAAVTAEGRPDKVVLVNADVPATRAGLGAANFIRWFETTFGKQVQFVASENGQPLSFGGLVLPSDPNTIFLDAAGNRNVLALLGHEWSHTLEHTNPALWKEIVTNLSPLVVDWAREQGKIVAEGYELSQAPSEFVANVIGDAFADPEFWAMVRQKDFGLFRRMLAAVQEWFDTIMDHASEWGTNAPDVIKDLQGMRELIAHAIEQAQAGPEAVAAGGVGVQAATPRGGHKFGERGAREKGEGYITPDEVKLMDADIAKILDKRGLKKGAARNKLAKQIRDQVQTDVLSRRKANPDAPTKHVKDPWSPLTFTGVDAEFMDAKEGEKPTTKSVAKWQKQNYRFDQIPEGMTRAEWAKELGGRIMSQWLDRMKKGFAEGATQKEREGAQLILDEIEWYRDFTGRLRGEFGGFADLMADFLGAYSPRQNVRQNWRNAIDSIWALSTGKYDQLFSELDAYLKADPARTIKTWRDQDGAVLRSRNNALFGTNTERGMMAALGLWREIKFGDKPKAKNFTRNLIALSIRATIDVWAARLLDRVAGKPRIPVDAEGAVSGQHVSAFVQDKGSKKRGDMPVTVDIAKLNESWMKDKDAFVGEGGAGGIGTRYQNFGQWLTRGETIEMPQVSIGHRGDIQFTNGRHRFAWLRDQGRKTIEISVSADQAKEIQERFGADPRDVSAELPIKGQFAFGQEVFEDVAARMRDPASWVGSGLSAETIAKFSNVTAADVQATNWFVEKEIWTENNWTNDEGSGGSFMFEIKQMMGARFQAGISQQISGVAGVEDYLPQNAEQARFATELRDDLSKMMPDAIALRVMDSLGMFKGQGERSLDTEWVHGPGMEPNDVIRAMLYHAWSKDQAATHISRVITDPDEDVSENARPGIEVMFKADVGLEKIKEVLTLLEKNKINGFTMVVDPRAGVGAQQFLGVRFQYVPEYSGDSGKNWVRKARVIHKILVNTLLELQAISGVADARTTLYDTLVFEKGQHYDDAGIHPGSVGTSEARAWRRRYFDAVAKEAVRRDGTAPEEGREGGQAGAGQQVSSGERVQGGPAAPGLAPEGPTLPVTVFDRDLMEFAPREMVATPELLRKLKADTRLYDQILSCLGT